MGYNQWYKLYAFYECYSNHIAHKLFRDFQTQYMINVTTELIHAHEADSLLNASDRYMESLYPAESNHLAYLDELLAPTSVFIGAYVEDIIVGCGAFVAKFDIEEYGEIKRIFVDEAYRGYSIGTVLMNRLETLAIERGIKKLKLETGIFQDPAIRLYQNLGYEKVPPFGDYNEDPLSIFMEKIII